MSEQSKHDDFLPPAQEEQDVMGLLKKIQQQMVLLEKKMDTLLSQSQPRPSSGERHFSRPFRSFGGPHQGSGRPHGSSFGDKSFDRGRRFEKPYRQDDRGFDSRKKPYDNARGSDAQQGKPFEKRFDSDKRQFSPRKKSFSFKRKDHR